MFQRTLKGRGPDKEEGAIKAARRTEETFAQHNWHSAHLLLTLAAKNDLADAARGAHRTWIRKR
jgi:hypothetical protein